MLESEMLHSAYGPNQPVRSPSVLGVLIWAISEYGPVEQLYPLLFEKLNRYRTSEAVRQNWAMVIFACNGNEHECMGA